jgi:adenylosuccinate lyase
MGDETNRNADISSKVSSEEIARVFDLKHYLRNVHKVFDRVFE